MQITTDDVGVYFLVRCESGGDKVEFLINKEDGEFSLAYGVREGECTTAFETLATGVLKNG